MRDNKGISMNKTTRNLLILLPVVALTACGQRKPELVGDPALRLMLGIRSLAGSFILPPGEDYYEIAFCNCEDGKVTKRHSVLWHLPNKNVKEGRQIKPELLWGNMGGKSMVCVTLDGNGGPIEDPFWSHLDGSSMWVANGVGQTPDGSTVLGFGTSEEGRGLPQRAR